MKKILPAIFILLIFVNIFAPFSVGLNSKNSPEIKTNVVEADDQTAQQVNQKKSEYDAAVKKREEACKAPNGKSPACNDAIKAELEAKRIFEFANTINERKSEYDAAVKKREDACKAPNGESAACKDATKAELQAQRIFDYVNKSARDYSLTLDEKKSEYDAATIKENDACNTDKDSQACIDAKKETLRAKQALDKATPKIDADTLPECNPLPLVGEGTLMGCIAQGIYYVLFVPTSYLFALTGQLFDWAFHYSVSDEAYRSPFVVQGWGLVRDFCNLFFIFVLLYVAISTTLSIHGFKTKEMIINVVIIGLLMNFSLFAAQVIIDTSNILARSIYNSDAIKITKNGANCTTDPTNEWCADLGQGINTEPGGIIPLSAALVNKVNPQNLITEGRRAVYIEDKAAGVQGNSTSEGKLGTGAFILITFLAIAVNIVGLIVFLSVGLMFFSRVIGLWLSMIFVPLAFFSYTVPAMQGISMVGWKHWWPETIKLAFMAPVFIFFLYIILRFLETGFSFVDAASKTGTAFVIGIVVPFIFIMMLLWKAKDLAKDMSGKIGQSITGGVAAVGGLALGGAALGGAFAGRQIIGRGMAKISSGEDTMHYGKEKFAFNQKLDAWKAGGKKGAKPTWENHVATNNADPSKKNIKTGLMYSIGGNINAAQRKVKDVDHERHEEDDIKKKAGLEGKDEYQLSGIDKETMQTIYTKEKKSVIESDVRNGKKDLIDESGVNHGNIGDNGYKAKIRNQEENAYIASIGKPLSYKSSLTEQDKKNIEDRLKQKVNLAVNASIDVQAKAGFEHMREGARREVGGVTRMVAGANKASYDPRKISDSKQDRREGWLTKGSTAMMAAIALGVRSGLKSSGVNHGAGQGDLIKDLGNTITEALKSVKVNVKIDTEEHSSGKADATHGGGH